VVGTGESTCHVEGAYHQCFNFQCVCGGVRYEEESYCIYMKESHSLQIDASVSPKTGRAKIINMWREALMNRRGGVCPAH